jgi:hypothetical protein
MFDYHDADFAKTDADPRLGRPVCTPDGVIFLIPSFDQYNVEFTNTRVTSSLAPPVMVGHGSWRCIQLDRSITDDTQNE